VSEDLRRVDRIRRGTRNLDVIWLCDLCIKLLRNQPVTNSVTSVTKGVTPKRDRAAYMRGYRQRAK
jgi:hypothetical protein